VSRESDFSELVLARLAQLLEGQRRNDESQRRIERRLEDIAHDTDALDRSNRPYGDGTRLPRRRRRGQ
jgi:hypothetical protein